MSEPMRCTHCDKAFKKGETVMAAQPRMEHTIWLFCRDCVTYFYEKVEEIERRKSQGIR